MKMISTLVGVDPFLLGYLDPREVHTNSRSFHRQAASTKFCTRRSVTKRLSILLVSERGSDGFEQEHVHSIIAPILKASHPAA